MKKKKLFCLIFFCFVVIPVFCKNQFTVNKKKKILKFALKNFHFQLKKIL